MPERQIIVTGASRGIGAAIAMDLDRRNYEVVGLSRGGQSVAGRGIACDVTDENAVRAVFADIAAAGSIVGLVNNAGLHLTAPSAELLTKDFEQVMTINTTSVMVSSREVYPYMQSAGGGCIINIGSFFDKMGVSSNLAYCASKAAVAAITRCLSVEWAKDDIRVLNVAPGYIATDLNRDFLSKESVQAYLAKRIPSGKPGGAADVARMVGAIFDADIPFFTGETIYLDGGQGMNH